MNGSYSKETFGKWELTCNLTLVTPSCYALFIFRINSVVELY